MARPATVPRRVLVVDDDEGVRQLMIDAFDRAGYSTTAVATAEEALDRFETIAPDCVLLDVKLPGVSGYEACVQMREVSGEDLSIIFVSGAKMDPLDRAAGLMMGADDYILKPLSIDELLARVRRSLRAGHAETSAASLTRRELEVLNLAAEGHAQGDIAATLFISPKTVATHMENIFKKLRVANRAEAVAAAKRLQLLV